MSGEALYDPLTGMALHAAGGEVLYSNRVMLTIVGRLGWRPYGETVWYYIEDGTYSLTWKPSIASYDLMVFGSFFPGVGGYLSIRRSSSVPPYWVIEARLIKRGLDGTRLRYYVNTPEVTDPALFNSYYAPFPASEGYLNTVTVITVSAS
jgi:hypothetical protein